MVLKRLSTARVKASSQRQPVLGVVASSQTYLMVLNKTTKCLTLLIPPMIHHLALTVKLIWGPPASSRKTTALTRLATITTTVTTHVRIAPPARLRELSLKTSSATTSTPLPLINSSATQTATATATATPTPTTPHHLPGYTLLSFSPPHPLLIHGARSTAVSMRNVSPRFRDRCTCRNLSSRSRSLLPARLQVRPCCLVSLHIIHHRGPSSDMSTEFGVVPVHGHEFVTEELDDPEPSDTTSSDDDSTKRFDAPTAPCAIDDDIAW